jgi:hypothetical protein
MSTIAAGAATLHRESFAWIVAQRDYFRLDRGFISDDASFALKSFTELVFYADRLAGAGMPRAQLEELSTFIASQLAAFDWIAAATYSPEVGAALGYVWSFCQRFDIPLPFGERAARRLIGAGYLDSVERVPFRAIEVAFSMRPAGAQLSAVAAAFAGLTTGGASPLSPHTNRTGMYSVTHTIFFAADFGAQALEPILGPSTVEGFKRFTRLGTAYAARDRDLDLIAEWLICWCVLGLEPGPLARAALDMLVAGRNADGSRPACTFDENRRAELTPDAAAEYAFIHSYHTTLVSGLCGALWNTRLASAGAAA